MRDTPATSHSSLNGSSRILVTVLLLSLAALAQYRPADQQGAAYIQQNLERSLITFGVARGLNGVISVAQGTEIAVEPAGIGVNLAIGEILDPVNDLIERFSWVMLASSTSLGIQAVMLDMGGGQLISFSVSILSLVVLLLLWRPEISNRIVWQLMVRALILFSFMRFTVLAITLLNQPISDYFLSSKIAASTEVLKQTTERIQQVEDNEQPDPKETSGVVERFQGFFRDIGSTFDAKKKLAHYQEVTAKAVNHIIQLAALFIVQTLLIPLLFLWALLKLMRYLLSAL